MRIDKLCVAIAGLKSKYKLDSTDVLLLNAIVSTHKDNGGATIMGIIRNFKAASHATTHSRIKKLVKHGLIDRVADETNLRIKKLQPTAKYNDLVKYLGEI